MRRISVLVIAVVLLGLLAPQARAANTISFAQTYPKKGDAGVILGKGTFTLDAGWSVNKVTLIASPQGGGVGGNTDCTFDATAKTWGESSISGLPNGTYNVFARMLITNGTLTYNIDSETKTVTLP